MNDIRASGEPLPFGPKAERIVTGFIITLTEPMQPCGKIRFTIDKYTMKRILRGNFRRVICPFCAREYTDEEHLCCVWLEDHIHRYHGTELSLDDPLHRRSLMQKLMDWLFKSDADPIDL